MGRHRGDGKKQRPDPASKLGRLYDAFLCGEPVNLRGFGITQAVRTSMLGSLRDFYGCEIIPGKGRNNHPRMIGVWDGPYFVPVERILQNENSPKN